eukprot:Partr_v1_DN26855_c0_g1_i3_m40685 putative Ethanolamine kinase
MQISSSRRSNSRNFPVDSSSTGKNIMRNTVDLACNTSNDDDYSSQSLNRRRSTHQHSVHGRCHRSLSANATMLNFPLSFLASAETNDSKRDAVMLLERAANGKAMDDVRENGYDEAVRLLAELPFIDREIRHDFLEEDALEIIHRIFPAWDTARLKISRCTDGITNKLLKIRDGDSKTTVLIRCYGAGTNSIIDRQSELISIITLSSLDFSPPIYGRFKNGFCYGFMEGEVMTPDEIVKPAMGALIARKLASWHKIPFPLLNDATPQPLLWTTMTNWLAQIPEMYDNRDTQLKFLSKPYLSLKHIASELALLEKELRAASFSKIVFCHNDLLAANIILQRGREPRKSDSTESLTHIDSDSSLANQVSFIDYEYGAYSYNSFDIANHFNEYAGFQCDYSRFPSLEHQRTWIIEYLTEFLSNVPTENQIEGLLEDVQKFSLISHFYWAIWALVQACLSDIDFDYMEYAIMRFEEYYRRKALVL